MHLGTGHSRAFLWSDGKDIFSTLKAAQPTWHRRGSFHFADNAALMPIWGCHSAFAGWTPSPLHHQAVKMLISVHVRYYRTTKALIPLHPVFSREENGGKKSGNMKLCHINMVGFIAMCAGQDTKGPSMKDLVLLIPVYIWPPKSSQPPLSLLKDKPTTTSSSNWAPWPCWWCGWGRLPKASTTAKWWRLHKHPSTDNWRITPAWCFFKKKWHFLLQ